MGVYAENGARLADIQLPGNSQARFSIAPGIKVGADLERPDIGLKTRPYAPAGITQYTSNSLSA